MFLYLCCVNLNNFSTPYFKITVKLSMLCLFAGLVQDSEDGTSLVLRNTLMSIILHLL